jgi:hypothetical protein
VSRAALRVFVDADVIFCGAAAPHAQGASHVLLALAEITLIEAVTSQQAINEVERNLAAKLPAALPVFRLLTVRCLQIVPDPDPAAVLAYAGCANRGDLPLLVAALQNRCPYLVTFNTRHYRPGHADVMVLRPGEFVLRLRELLADLSAN